MNVVDLIIAKRDGRELTGGEIAYLVRGFTDGSIPDYQVSAWLMAVVLRGMTRRETVDLTTEIVNSGRRLDLSAAGPHIADKHSTGGVGDKTTLVVAPMVAAAGLPVGKMSGRGLGFSGGTIDKLESIPGFRSELSVAEFTEGLRKVGLVIASQTADLAPADGRLYAMRDVTGTVESLPLIASSIMSKKIAAGANILVLDVKVGRGAFMKSIEDARELAVTMRDIGREVGLKVRAVLSGMDQPLGYAVGNALEVEEAISTLRGDGPDDLLEVALTLGTAMLEMAGTESDHGSVRASLLSTIATGTALNKFREFVVNQGGDAAVIDRPPLLPVSSFQFDVGSPHGGYLSAIDAEVVGRLSVALGAGRETKGAVIDHSVGFVLHRKLGEKVSKGDCLVTVHAANEHSGQKAARDVEFAFEFSDIPTETEPVILEVIA